MNKPEPISRVTLKMSVYVLIFVTTGKGVFKSTRNINIGVFQREFRTSRCKEATSCKFGFSGQVGLVHVV